MKTEYFDLKNKRALVSGGASGIGSSIVENLCEQGVEVYFFDINKNEAKKTINNICLLYTSPSPRDYAASRMPSSA